MPRAVAYNWQALGSTTEMGRSGIIKNNTPLLDYKAMLYSLGFLVPEFLDIRFELVDALPFYYYAPNQQGDAEYDVEFNFSSYVSELTVPYPPVPESTSEPFALCDLIARRANQPFTTT